MNEITEILKAYQKASKANIRTALATVVKVEGSSYRRPGARMLVTETGQLTGAISGGCLEGDALRKALAAIHLQENRLVTYDTSDEDDAKLGVQLGCNGIVYILFEPLTTDAKINPIAILNEVAGKREDAAIAVLFSLERQQHAGTQLLLKADAGFRNIQGLINSSIEDDLQEVLLSKTSVFKDYTFDNQQVTAFLEFISTPIALVIAGAGNDAQPLAQMCHLLGWQVTVIDGRPAQATKDRFPTADCVLVAKASEVDVTNGDARTAFVLMTHNYNYDIELLGRLLATNTPYIGSLGPKKKLLKMLDELGLDTEPNRLRVHGPVGLDIGAETAAEIAVSIVAEIKAFFSGAAKEPLKNKILPIHQHVGL
jgi:xanthine/CO dehydrogenase XdhC/CoxF family maturation factor